MSKMLFLIAWREYLERVRTRSFLIMTVLIPAIGFGVTVVPSLISARFSGRAKHLVVANADPQTAQLIRTQLQKPLKENLKDTGSAGSGSAEVARYQVDLDSNVSDSERAALARKVQEKQLDGVIWGTDDALTTSKITYITRDLAGVNDLQAITSGVSKAMQWRFLQKKGLAEADIASALGPHEMETLNPAGHRPSNPFVIFLVVLSMVMLLYISVLLYGNSISRSILEEKTSRIMEVMLSIASAQEMMLGKILGVGAVGLTQVVIWAATAGVLSMPGLIAGADQFQGIISLRLVIFFPIFFLLGYTLFSTLNAAIGAMVNSDQEAQQLQFVVVMPLLLSVVLLSIVIQNPGAPIALWASIFPFTASLIMFARIALDPTVPGWQIALSIGLLVVTIYGMLVACGRIYRIGILMYGKKPTLPEILKWMKYA